MSLTLNMVGGGSGGGISGNTAVLEVIAPVGSAVSITDGVTTKTQTPADGHPVSDRQTVAAYIFPVGSDELGDWTVTATRGTESNTTTATISAIMDYVIYIGYHVPLQTYQEVEFLQSTGTQGILVSGTYGNGTSFELKVQPTVRPSSGGQFFGFGTSSNRGNHQFDNTGWGAYYHSDYRTLLSLTEVPSTYGIVTGAFSSNTFNTSVEYNGDTGSYSYSYTIPSYSGTTLFYSRNSNGNAERGSSKIFYYKLWKNDVLTIEAYPCYRLSDSVAGFYDKVSDTFYTNQGSGTFTVGGDV